MTAQQLSAAKAFADAQKTYDDASETIRPLIAILFKAEEDLDKARTELTEAFQTTTPLTLSRLNR